MLRDSRARALRKHAIRGSRNLRKERKKERMNERKKERKTCCETPRKRAIRGTRIFVETSTLVLRYIFIFKFIFVSKCVAIIWMTCCETIAHQRCHVISVIGMFVLNCTMGIEMSICIKMYIGTQLYHYHAHLQMCAEFLVTHTHLNNTHTHTHTHTHTITLSPFSSHRTCVHPYCHHGLAF